MTLKLNGTNSEAAPAYAGDDADTGLQCGTNELKLVTGGSARVIVDSSGRVGIGGVTSPFDKLHVKTATDCNYNFSSAGGTEASLEIFNDAGTSNTPLNIRASVYKFKVQSTEKCRITSDGLTFNGDTAAANALSDYEEGTWTPTTAGDSTGVISNASGFYTKIGNTVVCSFSFTLVTNFTNSDVGGLPFTPKDIGPNFNGAFVQTTADRAFVVQNHNSKLATLKISNGTYPAVTNSTRCTITYLTD